MRRVRVAPLLVLVIVAALVAPRAAPEPRAGACAVSRLGGTPNGWIRTKVGWWRARGALRLRGRRLDAAAPPLRADVGTVTGVFPGRKFVPSLLYFPSPGCWRLTASAGGARLVAVIRVVVA